MNELIKTPNIGAILAQQLNEVGITTFEQLKEIGSRQAWLEILVIDSSAYYNRLCGLEGAIRNIRWHYLPDEVKKELKEFYNKIKKGGLLYMILGTATLNFLLEKHNTSSPGIINYL